MADRDDENHHQPIFDSCDHAIVAEAIAPVPGMVADHGFAALARTVERCYLAKALGDPRGRLGAKFCERFFRFAA